MTRLVWDRSAMTEAGLDRGVLYLDEGAFAWNGLIAATDADSSEVSNEQYFDGRRFRIAQNLGDYSVAVEAFTYPQEFSSYDGLDGYFDHQTRKRFGFSYRTQELDGTKIHLVYNVLAKPTTKSHKTRTLTVDPTNFLWDFASTPVHVPNSNRSGHLIVDVTGARYPEAVSELEDILYGTETTTPRFPAPEEVLDIFDAYVIFRVVYNNDGTWTATGPDDWIQVGTDGTYEITSPSAWPIDEHFHRISSY